MNKQPIRILRYVDGEWAGTYTVQRVVKKARMGVLLAFIENQYRPLKLNAAKELTTEIRVNRECTPISANSR